uniref:RING-type domain-containing protein n=1 Tax=viral metagenome TaxID=1070528 RepID=A0A6C0F711_9ZZZZ
MNTFNNNRGRTTNARSAEFLRAFVSEYNQIIHAHSEMMLEYNRNVSNIMRILQRGQDMAPPPAPAPTPVATTGRTSNRSDIATLIYLLSQANTEEIQIGLTPAQILSATQIITYTPGSFNETQCPISLEEFVENERVCQIRHCQHIFRRPNLLRWFESHVGCPVCRYDLRGADTEENDNNASVSSMLSTLFNSDISGNGIYSFEFPVRFR